VDGSCLAPETDHTRKLSTSHTRVSLATHFPLDPPIPARTRNTPTPLDRSGTSQLHGSGIIDQLVPRQTAPRDRQHDPCRRSGLLLLRRGGNNGRRRARVVVVVAPRRRSARRQGPAEPRRRGPLAAWRPRHCRRLRARRDAARLPLRGASGSVSLPSRIFITQSGSHTRIIRCTVNKTRETCSDPHVCAWAL
jgi:hypothetical protein